MAAGSASTSAPSKLRFARYAFMELNLLLSIAAVVVSALGTNSIGLMVTTASALVATLVYIPTSLVIAWRQVEESKFDHAGGEVAFLSVQAALWAASSVVGGVTGGPGICHTSLYSSGRLANSFPGYRMEISKLAEECHYLTIVTVLSVLLSLLTLAWIALDVYLVYSSSSSSTRGEGFKLPMWKLSRGVYRQVGQSEDAYAHAYGGHEDGPVMATPMKGGYSGYSYAQRQTLATSSPGPIANTRSPVNPFGSTYEVDSVGAFDNPFERTPTRQSRR